MALIELRGTAVSNAPRQSVIRIYLRRASAALTFAVVLGVVTNQLAQGQTFTELYKFTGLRHGGNPSAGLVRDTAGNLYGTTQYGGNVSCNPPDGCGIVFKVTKEGKETVLYDFCSVSGCTDGAFPVAGLVLDSVGNLYGTSRSGGDLSCSPPGGCGTVFKVNANGKETVLHSFSGGATDGIWPLAGLVRDVAGNLYGTTSQGGGTGCDYGYGCGTVFKLSKTGKETLLHSFTYSDGAYPVGGVVRDQAGNLYGTTYEGGNYCYDDQYCGVAYKLSTSGKETVLHFFSRGDTDGCFPYGTPTIDESGNLYGTTSACGSHGAGTVWRVSKKGKETVLYGFTGPDGSEPYAGVIVDEEGNLYGDTVAGGASGDGTVYELSKKGVLTVLHSFDVSDGNDPEGGLIRDAKGNLYGTTYGGGDGGNSCIAGSQGCGTVFKVTP
jgi:uncharacterized repeat protein (TIGR03803 family)